MGFHECLPEAGLYTIAEFEQGRNVVPKRAVTEPV